MLLNRRLGAVLIVAKVVCGEWCHVTVAREHSRECERSAQRGSDRFSTCSARLDRSETLFCRTGRLSREVGLTRVCVRRDRALRR